MKRLILLLTLLATVAQGADIREPKQGLDLSFWTNPAGTPTKQLGIDATTGYLKVTAGITNAAGTGAPTLPFGASMSAPELWSNGAVGAPSAAFTNSPTTGLYRVGSNILGFTTNGVTAGQVDATQNWTFGNTTVNSTHTFQSNWTASSTQDILKVQRQGAAVAATIGYNDATTRMYFGTSTNHALDFRTNSTIAGSIDTSQKWTIGASSSTQTHTVNGSGTQFLATGAANQAVIVQTGATGTFADLDLEPVTTANTGRARVVAEIPTGADSGTTPVMTFHVNNSSTNNVISTRPLFQWENHTTSVGVIDVTGGWTFGPSAGSIATFQGQSAQVGIGTTPSFPLHVRPSAGVTGYISTFDNQSATGDGLRIYDNNASASHFLLTLEASTGVKFQVKNDGSGSTTGPFSIGNATFLSSSATVGGSGTTAISTLYNSFFSTIQIECRDTGSSTNLSVQTWQVVRNGAGATAQTQIGGTTNIGSGHPFSITSAASGSATMTNGSGTAMDCQWTVMTYNGY